MATLDSVKTKLRNLLSSLSTKMGTTYTTFTAAINALPSKKTEGNVTLSGSTVTVPAGIYFSDVQKIAGSAIVATTTVIIDTENVISNGYGVDVYYSIFENNQIVNAHQYVDAFGYVVLNNVVKGSVITFISDFWLDDSTNMLFGAATQGYQWAYAYKVSDGAYFAFWE